jgi:hypothetical protein
MVSMNSQLLTLYGFRDQILDPVPFTPWSLSKVWIGAFTPWIRIRIRDLGSICFRWGIGILILSSESLFCPLPETGTIKACLYNQKH